MRVPEILIPPFPEPTAHTAQPVQERESHLQSLSRGQRRVEPRRTAPPDRDGAAQDSLAATRPTCVLSARGSGWCSPEGYTAFSSFTHLLTLPLALSEPRLDPSPFKGLKTEATISRASSLGIMCAAALAF